MNDNRHEPTEIPTNEHDTETGGDARPTTDLDDLRREIAELKEAIRAREEVDAQTSKPAPASIDGSAGRSNATLPLTAAALAAMKPAAIARLDWNTVRDVLANG
jgi:hypothetical protein